MIFEVVGSAEQLRQQLQQYKDRLGHDRRPLALIINLGRSHWVTLVVASDNQQSPSAYYIDSLGNNAPSWISEVVVGEIHNIYSSGIIQQEDSFNCGIFALENIRIMSDVIRSDDDEQVFQVEDYRPSREKLQEIRQDFMIVLRYYLGYG